MSVAEVTARYHARLAEFAMVALVAVDVVAVRPIAACQRSGFVL